MMKRLIAILLTLLSGYTVGPIVTPTSTSPEAEQVIAVDPLNPENVITAVVDFSLAPPNGLNKYAVSNDGGNTWAESFAPSQTSDGISWKENRDPSLAVDTSGNAYLGGLYELPVGGHNLIALPGGVYVCSGTMPTPVFGNCNPVFSSISGTTTEDSPKIAVDSLTGNLYATWEHFIDCNGRTCGARYIAFSRSLDHGATWSPILQINPVTQTKVTWPQLAIDANGTIYLAYQSGLDSGKFQHLLTTSLDAGQTFPTPVALSPIIKPPTFPSIYRKNTAPNIAVTPAGTVYDVYTAQGRGSHIMLATGGKAIKVDKATVGQRFMPSIAISSNGTINLAWFDTRNYSAVTSFDVYALYSLDGKTFAPEVQVTTSSGTAGKFIGDYSGMTVDQAGLVHVVWNDGTKLQTTTLALTER
jgi:flagellar hook protein FlgE